MRSSSWGWCMPALRWGPGRRHREKGQGTRGRGPGQDWQPGQLATGKAAGQGGSPQQQGLGRGWLGRVTCRVVQAACLRGQVSKLGYERAMRPPSAAVVLHPPACNCLLLSVASSSYPTPPC